MSTERANGLRLAKAWQNVSDTECFRNPAFSDVKKFSRLFLEEADARDKAERGIKYFNQALADSGDREEQLRNQAVPKAKLLLRISELESRIASLEGALEFYRDRKYMQAIAGIADNEPFRADVDIDRGDRARQVLANSDPTAKPSLLTALKSILEKMGCDCESELGNICCRCEALAYCEGK